MDARVGAAPPIASRRYGAVNWVGLQTLIGREIKRFLKVGSQTVFAPLLSTLLFMLIFGVVRQGGWPGTTHSYRDGLAAGLVMMSVLSNAFQNSSSSVMIAKVQGNAVDFLMPPLSALELKGEVEILIRSLIATGAHIHIPRADQEYAVEVGLRMLLLRHFVEEQDGLYRANPREEILLRYYANSIAHLLPAANPQVAAAAE